ncbi:M15 family metallopeptidase [Novilysobacter avium]|uniref:D-alanyl-D-alanine carboxypeptidase family protein n=1 Tax=Novilysobacter avium TaxID=2781023 RepID=A0A7S6ZUB9_9GAMM|nr:M15 family metallopeptidase [Lysobacter avium]QOW21499.1 D-alanyl-D-alanine carboxypeptidase family protein [Lysobacter avium]
MRGQLPVLIRTSLINTPDIELWPHGLLQARSNHDARLLARAHRVFRRKRDGRYLAAATAAGLTPLLHGWQREPGIDAAIAALAAHRAPPAAIGSPALGLPLDRLQRLLDTLGIDDGYGRETRLPLVAEPTELAFAGFDRYHRALWLQHGAARAWSRMQAAALNDDVVLEAISGYRSHDYQFGIFQRKLARGQTVAGILAVNAAPGYSEHHSGCALDIGAPGEPPAEECFEHTGAFAWLTAHAGDHGFRMSYPRDNPHGIVYEPWHWYWIGGAERSRCDTAA